MERHLSLENTCLKEERKKFRLIKRHFNYNIYSRLKKKKNTGYVSKVAKIQTREGNLLKIKEKPFSNNRGYLWWSPILKDDNQYIKYKSFM